MINKIIEVSVQHKFMVLFLTCLSIGGGIYAMRNIPLDAIPDLSDVQVIILTEYPGQAPQVVEDQVTYPLSSAMLSVPFAKTVRGYSFFGLSFVYILFADDTDIYWARSRVLEYLNVVSDRLPDGAVAKLGPDATGIGWVYEYVLEDTTNQYDLAQLRSIQDWYLRYELTSIAGVSEVASIGGFVKQYQVVVDPIKLQAFNIPLEKVSNAIKRSNNNVGGRLIEWAESEFMVRGVGNIESLADIGSIPVSVSKTGIPVRIKDIATVQIGPDLRRGVAEWDGQGEIVGGIVVMRYGENALALIKRIKARLEELKVGLPPGIVLRPAYDRSGLINRAIDNLQKKLLMEILVVALVCIVFLLHFRSALVAILILPIGILIAFIVMYNQDVNANIMSLGGIAIAIGVMVDAGIVMVENVHKHMERDRGKKDHWQIILDASKEVGPPLFYSLLIITCSFLPVFTLQAQEGRLFQPLAFTKTYAMAAVSLLAITLVPVLMGFFIRGRIISENKNPFSRVLIWAYRPLLQAVLRHRNLTLILAGTVIFFTFFPFHSQVLARFNHMSHSLAYKGLFQAQWFFPIERIGSEFMPPLDEGDLLYMPTTLPGISITKARELLQQTDKIIHTFPEVDHVFGKVGRAETATDLAPLSMLETTIQLKPETAWRQGMDIEKLIKEMDAALQFPGLTNAWTMPIKTRIDMLSTGIKTPVGIKVAGPDLVVLEDIGQQIEGIIEHLPGTLSVYAERVTGGNYLDLDIRRDEAARYGLTVGDVQDIIMSALGGVNIAYTVEGLERYPINLRYGRELRDNLPALRRILVPTPTGVQIPIQQLADIQISKGPASIKSENARPNAWIYVDIKDIDVGRYVQQAQQAVRAEIEIPPGYSLTWSGQYEYMQRAEKRLLLVIPITLGIIFILLFLNFNNLFESLLVMLALPFALAGGIWLIYLLDYNMSVAVWVGFIALAGLTVELGVVLLIYLNQAYNSRHVAGQMQSREDLHQSIITGSVLRVRPLLMTVISTMAGLLPILWGDGTGTAMMKRIAAPIVGGMISATLLTLLVIPVIYAFWKGRGFK